MRKGTCLLLASAVMAAVAVVAQPVMSVKITSPSNNDHFAQCSNIVVAVDPQIQGGEIKNVILYRNNVGIAAKTKAPWECPLKNYPPGYYVLTAKLTAKTNEVVYSDPVVIYVGNVEKGNILANGGFECAILPWNLSLNGGARATFKIDTAAGISSGAAAVVEIDSGGTAYWHVQIGQPLPIDSGHTYIFSFAAFSTESSKIIDVSIQMNRDPWTVYYVVNPVIDALQDYGPYTWECPVTDHDAYIRFNVGNTNHTTFWLDDAKWLDQSLTGLKDRKPPNADEAPSRSLLGRNYPNPFNPGTTIQYHLPEPGSVTLTVYNVKGQAVRTLVQENQNGGDHSIQWNSTNEAGDRAPSGVYVYRLKVKTAMGTSTLSRKIMLLE